MENLFLQLEEDQRKKKQQEALMIFLKYLYEESNRDSIKKNLVTSHPDISKSSLQTLISNGILIEFHVQVDRILMHQTMLFRLHPYPVFNLKRYKK
ncbi:MAG: hypothetical protein IPL24_00945 [Bacteroidetes bacterium]|nr:hypothetical protein [Bacteroidota bacterium]